MPDQPPSVLRSKLFWVGLLYFAEGFPLGVFYDIFPVHFRQQGVALWEIGFMSLLGLSWTLKFLWAPAVDHYRHHRRWMAGADLLMGAVLLVFAAQSGFGPWVWLAIGAFTLLSATNDIAIDGYTIELLNRRELGLANGLRIGFYRVGMLAAGLFLVLSDLIGWSGAYLCAAGLLAALALACLQAPPERKVERPHGMRLREELTGLLRQPRALAAVLALLGVVLWVVDRETALRETLPGLWWLAGAAALALLARAVVAHRRRRREGTDRLRQGPMFGTLLDMLARPHMWGVVVFVLLFKLGDSAMGFMVKPFWVDAGFSASAIGLVSVNLGLVLSILGGVVGGWITDRIGLFRGLWVLGLFQAVSNLGYAWAAGVLPTGAAEIPLAHTAIMYGASAVESFTGGLGTAAFLAFLMAIVNKRHAATEYALLSSIFALSRSLAGWGGGFGAQIMGYADYFLLTFFLAFPAYALLPWAKRMLDYAGKQTEWGQR